MRVAVLILVVIFNWTGMAAAQSFEVDDQVQVSNDNANGVPLHRQAQSSRFAYLPQNTVGLVSEVSSDGDWLHIITDSSAGWVLTRYTQPAGAPIYTQEPSAPFDPLSSLSCEGEAYPSRRRLDDDPLFTVCFDTTLRIPVWVAYRLTHEDLEGDGDRNRSDWEQDIRIRADDQAHDPQYVRSGFHRGHMAPAEAFIRTQLAMDTTHLFSNAVPQRGTVNSGAWRVLESRVLDLITETNTVWVVTGSFFLDLPDHCARSAVSSSCVCLSGAGDPDATPRRMRQSIAIPSHSFKAILVGEGEDYEAYGFAMANVDYRMGDFRQYQYAIDTIEARSGLNLFVGPDGNDLVDEARLTPIDPGRRVTRCQS